MADKIFLSDAGDYVIATGFDQATEKYIEIRGKDPVSLTLFKDTEFVITESTVVVITPEVSPAGAISAGATVSPSTEVYIKEGDQITLTATGAGAFPTFVEWQDGDSNVLSTDNPFTYTATAVAITIKGIFSA